MLASAEAAASETSAAETAASMDGSRPLTADEVRAFAAAEGLELETESLELEVEEEAEPEPMALEAEAGTEPMAGTCSTLEVAATFATESAASTEAPVIALRCATRGISYIGPERAAIEAAEARFAATLQPLTAAEARAAAVSEGLELVLSSNSETGFKGVYRKQSGKYPVTIHENGSMRYLGIFATAEEAALRYARYVGAARAAIEAAEARIAATLHAKCKDASSVTS